MLYKLAIFGLLLVLLGLTNSTVIEFTGKIYTHDEYIKYQILLCSNSTSEICQKLQQDLCEFILLKLGNGMIDGRMNCSASVKPTEHLASGEINMTLLFTDPTLLGIRVNLECSVFPILLKEFLFLMNYNGSTNVREVEFIKPKFSQLVWVHDKITFRVIAELLVTNKTLPPERLTERLKNLVNNLLEKLIPFGHFCYPLYPYRDKTITNINYLLEDTVKVNFTFDFPRSYLQTYGLDHTCNAFVLFLQWGLLNPKNKLPVNLGQPVQITLITKLPGETTMSSNTISTTTTVNTGTPTPSNSTDSAVSDGPTTTISTINSTVIDGPTTTISTIDSTDVGITHTCSNKIIWLGFFVANILSRI